MDTRESDRRSEPARRTDAGTGEPERTPRFEDVSPTTFDDGTPAHEHEHGDVTGAHAVHDHDHEYGTGETRGHGVHRIQEDESE